MNHEMDDDVKDILALLQQGNVEEKPVAKKVEKVEKAGKTEKVAATKQNSETPPKSEIQNPTSKDPSVSAPKKEKKTLVAPAQAPTFLADINEPEDKSVYNSKVLIREEIYEIFMSLKRIKKFKSVSTLVDFALEEYIKNNRDSIKATLYDNKKEGIL